jgi:hypothetical protein
MRALQAAPAGELGCSAKEGLGVDANARIRLSAQRALLTHVTPSLRAVSVEVQPAAGLAWMRFVFDGEPLPAAREVASCAHTELLTDFVDEWTVELEVVACVAPARMEHRRWLVYHRCEDAWVQDAE